MSSATLTASLAAALGTVSPTECSSMSLKIHSSSHKVSPVGTLHWSNMT